MKRQCWSLKLCKTVSTLLSVWAEQALQFLVMPWLFSLLHWQWMLMVWTAHDPCSLWWWALTDRRPCHESNTTETWYGQNRTWQTGIALQRWHDVSLGKIVVENSLIVESLVQLHGYFYPCFFLHNIWSVSSVHACRIDHTPATGNCIPGSNQHLPYDILAVLIAIGQPFGSG